MSLISIKNLFLAAVLLLFGAGVFFSGEKSKESGGLISAKYTWHKVELREDGFYPPLLTIGEGDYVKFITSRQKPFWPASNTHPSHEIYQEFDPKNPIPPDKSWSFQFKTAGIWHYHDHINPDYRGRIIVRDEHADIPQPNAKTARFKCDIKFPDTKSGQSDQIFCWDKLLLETTLGKGVDAALKVFQNLYEDSPLFRLHCHKHAHTVGLEAYWQFAKGEKFSLTDATTLCGYGFFHGFMQELVSHGQNFQKAEDFCESAAKALSPAGQRSSERCYHGIGHGLVYKYAGEQWGDEKNLRWILDRSLGDCQNLIPSEYKYDCNFGVFGGIESFYYGQHGYKLQVKKEDPFWLCREQEKDLRPMCYDAFVPFVYGELKTEATLSFIKKISDTESRRAAIKHFGLVLYKYEKGIESENIEKYLTPCRSTNDEALHLACIEGFAGGFIDSGKPEIAYLDALGFCGSSSLATEEQEACFFGANEMAVYLFPREEALRVCEKTPALYRKQCQSRFIAIQGN